MGSGSEVVNWEKTTLSSPFFLLQLCPEPSKGALQHLSCRSPWQAPRCDCTAHSDCRCCGTTSAADMGCGWTPALHTGTVDRQLRWRQGVWVHTCAAEWAGAATVCCFTADTKRRCSGTTSTADAQCRWYCTPAPQVLPKRWY